MILSLNYFQAVDASQIMTIFFKSCGFARFQSAAVWFLSPSKNTRFHDVVLYLMQTLCLSHVCKCYGNYENPNLRIRLSYDLQFISENCIFKIHFINELPYKRSLPDISFQSGFHVEIYYSKMQRKAQYFLWSCEQFPVIYSPISSTLEFLTLGQSFWTLVVWPLGVTWFFLANECHAYCRMFSSISGL